MSPGTQHIFTFILFSFVFTASSENYRDPQTFLHRALEILHFLPDILPDPAHQQITPSRETVATDSTLGQGSTFREAPLANLGHVHPTPTRSTPQVGRQHFLRDVGESENSLPSPTVAPEPSSSLVAAPKQSFAQLPKQDEDCQVIDRVPNRLQAAEDIVHRRRNLKRKSQRKGSTLRVPA